MTRSRPLAPTRSSRQARLEPRPRTAAAGAASALQRVTSYKGALFSHTLLSTCDNSFVIPSGKGRIAGPLKYGLMALAYNDDHTQGCK